MRPELQDGGGKEDEMLARFEKDSEDGTAVVKSKRQRRSQLAKEESSVSSSADPNA